MSRPTESTILRDYTLELKPLTRGSRTVSKVVVTATEAATAGDRTISLSSESTITIKAGTSLSFGGTPRKSQVLFTQDAAITSTPAEFDIAPLQRAIADNSTAEAVSGALPLFGIMTLDLQTQETQVDSTDFQSGSGTEMEIIRNGRSYSVSGRAVAGDQCLETVVKPLSLKTENTNQEVYAVATMPDGETFEGVAKITALNLPANQNEIKKYSFTLTFMGDTFDWESAYTFA